MASKALAVIAGAGPGTGQAVALRFAKLYNIILLARTPESYNETLKKIEAAGGSAHGIPTDITDEKSVSAAFEEMGKRFPDSPLAAAIYNVGGSFTVKPFLELQAKDVRANFEINGIGAFNFAQSSLHLLLKTVSKYNKTSETLPHPPTLLFTGATAAVKGSAKFAAISPGKFALRSLSQSLAREFGPKGVHVSHIIIDGLIDVAKTKEMMADVPDGKLLTDDIAESYFFLHSQPKTTWTWEMDLRPAVEKW